MRRKAFSCRLIVCLALQDRKREEMISPPPRKCKQFKNLEYLIKWFRLFSLILQQNIEFVWKNYFTQDTHNTHKPNNEKKKRKNKLKRPIDANHGATHQKEKKILKIWKSRSLWFISDLSPWLPCHKQKTYLCMIFHKIIIHYILYFEKGL